MQLAAISIESESSGCRVPSFSELCRKSTMASARRLRESVAWEGVSLSSGIHWQWFAPSQCLTMLAGCWSATVGCFSYAVRLCLYVMLFLFLSDVPARAIEASRAACHTIHPSVASPMNIYVSSHEIQAGHIWWGFEGTGTCDFTPKNKPPPDSRNSIVLPKHRKPAGCSKRSQYVPKPHYPSQPSNHLHPIVSQQELAPKSSPQYNVKSAKTSSKPTHSSSRTLKQFCPRRNNSTS